MKNLSVIIMLALLTACVARPRPAAPVAADTLTYAEAISQARREQLLLNIVRLRYNDPVSFIDLERLTTQDKLSIGGGLSSAISLDGSPLDEVLRGNVGPVASSQPTAVYSVLRGGAYAQQLLQPLPPASIFLLSQSGWSVERLMLCCVARIGALDNARSAAGPTPDRVPDNGKFRHLAGLMRDTQLDGGLLVQVINPEQESATPKVLMKWRRDTASGQALAEFMKKNWVGKVNKLAGGRYSAEITARGNVLGDYAVRGRSLLGIMSALSLTVHVPEAHHDIAPPVLGPSIVGNHGADVASCAAPHPWKEVTGGYFSVMSSAKKPTTAAVAVQYREHWYYIADTCRSAKATLNLVDHLYALQAGLSSSGETLLLLGG